MFLYGYLFGGYLKLVIYWIAVIIFMLNLEFVEYFEFIFENLAITYP
jgi:hypothetical protein